MRNDLYKLNDEEFLNLVSFHSNQVKEYLEKELYSFIAFYIAQGIECEAIFDYDFKRIVNTAMESFDSFQFRNDIDYNRIKKLLKKEYNITIINDNTIKIM